MRVIDRVRRFRPGRELRRADEGHLRADAGAVGGEEGEQAVVAGVAPGGSVAVDERAGEVGPLGLVELHDEEGQVEPRVDPAERGVELDRVDERGLGPEQHVLGAQVTVTVADPPVTRTGVELHPARSQEAGGEPLRRDEVAAERGVVAEQRRQAWRSRRRWSA